MFRTQSLSYRWLFSWLGSFLIFSAQSTILEHVQYKKYQRPIQCILYILGYKLMIHAIQFFSIFHPLTHLKIYTIFVRQFLH